MAQRVHGGSDLVTPIGRNKLLFIPHAQLDYESLEVKRELLPGLVDDDLREDYNLTQFRTKSALEARIKTPNKNKKGYNLDSSFALPVYMQLFAKAQKIKAFLNMKIPEVFQICRRGTCTEEARITVSQRKVNFKGTDGVRHSEKCSCCVLLHFSK